MKKIVEPSAAGSAGRAPGPAHPGQDGLAELVLAPRYGRTRLTHQRIRPPLSAHRALYPDEALADMAYVYLVNPTCGLLGNDRHRVSVTVAEGGRAHITTQNAAKVFTMPDGKAGLRVELAAAADAWLEYLPDPVIPYRGAELETDTEITVAPGGAVLFAEALTPGRSAMGESWQYRRLACRLAVRDPEGRRLYREAWDIAPAGRGLFTPAVLGEGARPRTLATALVITDRLPAPRLAEMIQDALPRADGILAAATALPNNLGAAVKAIADDTPLARSVLSACWAAARRLLLDAPPPTPRKY